MIKVLSSSWLSKEVTKRLFLESGLTKFLTVCYFGNILPMTMIIFKKSLKFDENSKKKQQKTEKKLFVFKIIAFE